MITEAQVRRREVPPSIRYHRSSLIRQADILTQGITLFETITYPQPFQRRTKEIQQAPQRSIFARRTEENARITAAAVIDTLRHGDTLVWQSVPAQVVRDVLQQVAESQQIPASMMRYSELTEPTDFLNGNSL